MLCFVDEQVRISQFPSSVYHGDTLHISCALNYSGLLAPTFGWIPSPGYDVPVVDTGRSVNSTVELNVTSSAVEPYTCGVNFNGSISPDTPSKTSQRVRTSGE